MKQILLLLLLFFGLQSFSQKITCEKIIDLDSNFYKIENNTLKKFSKDSSLLYTFSDATYGDIFSIDVSVPFKIIVFYKNFNHIDIIDERFSLENSIDLANYSINAEAVCSANNGRIIIYDLLKNSLIIFNPYSQKAEYSSVVNITDEARFLFAQNNELIWVGRNKIYILDNNFNLVKTYTFSAVLCDIVKGRIILKDKENKIFFNN